MRQPFFDPIIRMFQKTLKDFLEVGSGPMQVRRLALGMRQEARFNTPVRALTGFWRSTMNSDRMMSRRSLTPPSADCIDWPQSQVLSPGSW
jgi:hypothetical protein